MDNEDLMTVYLEVRRGNRRVSVSRQLSMLTWQQLGDNGYYGMYEAALAGMRVELEPYVKEMASQKKVQEEVQTDNS